MIEKSELKKMDGKECPLYDIDRNVIGSAKLCYEDGKLIGEIKMKDGKIIKGVVETSDIEPMCDPSVNT